MDRDHVQFISTRVADTLAIGSQFGALLSRGDIVLLSGDLGAGKTHFSKGVVAGIGSTDAVTSPTFVFINQYRAPQRLTVFHADLYRITTPAELDGIGIDDATDGSGICLIEWPERDPSLRNLPHLDVQLHHVDAHTRRIHIRAYGLRPQHVVSALQRCAAIQHLQDINA